MRANQIQRGCVSVVPMNHRIVMALLDHLEDLFNGWPSPLMTFHLHEPEGLDLPDRVDAEFLSKKHADRLGGNMFSTADAIFHYSGELAKIPFCRALGPSSPGLPRRNSSRPRYPSAFPARGHHCGGQKRLKNGSCSSMMICTSALTKARPVIVGMTRPSSRFNQR